MVLGLFPREVSRQWLGSAASSDLEGAEDVSFMTVSCSPPHTNSEVLAFLVEETLEDE